MGMIMFLVLLLLLLWCSWWTESSGIVCKEAERQALLNIKDGFNYGPEYVLRSWGTEDEECCGWIGIECDNRTGHVVHLDLSPSTFGTKEYDYFYLSGQISSSLLQLSYLNYLDLSGVRLRGYSIPSFLGNLTELRYLNLSSTSLSGKIPPQLGNLSRLQFLDLSIPYYDSRLDGLSMKTLDWASRLSSLQLLDLRYTNMSTCYDWVRVVNNLPSLTTLLFQGCSLPNETNAHSSLSFVNSSKSLSVLDLSRNPLSHSVFQWLFNYTHTLVHLDLSSSLQNGYSIPRAFESMASLEYLSLHFNGLGGSIPEFFGNMTNLKYLDLSSNTLEGSIPQSFGNIHLSLEYLDLSENRIIGPIPNFTFCPSLIELKLFSNRFHGNLSKSIGQLSVLKVLDISKNSLNGIMSEAHFSKLFSLNYLDLSSNPSLVLNISFHWVPPFQLEFVFLGSCKLGPHFPEWLQTQKSLLELDISNSSISSTVPDWFWISSTQYFYMNLSHNQISGAIKNYPSLKRSIFMNVDLSSNQFEGPIPLFLFRGQGLQLSNNKFSSLSSICNIRNLSELSLVDISFNELVGELPDCWLQFQKLGILVLTNNKLSGEIPISIGSLSGLEMLHLGSNNFSGKLPFSLRNCQYLEVLDVGENRLVGPIPKWIGVFESLIILNLRSNHFDGIFPSSLCHLVNIQILDLSSNQFSGTFPNCVSNLTAMKKIPTLGRDSSAVNLYYNGSRIFYRAQVAIIWKGKLSPYKSTLGLVKSFDVSSNKLVGAIPEEIALLDGLGSLNLSTNSLTGQIPSEIGNLKLLEVLDLSKNHLSGTIPSSLSGLSFMNLLDVSNNNLSGKIPTSTQLQTFDPSRFAGNSQLCGAPLPNCPEEEANTSTEDEEDSLVTRGLYVCMGLGFVVGFWGICGSLLFIESWRIAYFGFLNGVRDRIYVMIQLHKAKLLRMIKC